MKSASFISLRHISRKLPLRWVLVVPFVVLVSAAVGLTGWLSWRNGQRTVENLASQLENEVAQRIEQHLTSYLNVPKQINASNLEAIRLGLLDPQNPEQLAQTFWQQVRVNPAISYIYFAKDQDGGFVDAGRQSSGRLVIEQTENYVAGDFYIYATDGNANRTEVLSVDPDYDPRIRPWYTVVANQRYPRWSEIYAMFPDNILAITASMPAYAEDGTFLGVFAADLTLAQLTRFLQQLKIGNLGQAAIIERTGNVVALSSDEVPFLQENLDEEPERFLLKAAQSPVLAAAAVHLEKTFTDLQNIRKSEQMSFEWEGDRQYLQVVPFRDQMRLDWLIIVVVPESDFMSEVNANQRQTVILSLVALAGAIALGIYTAHWISQPIERINQASEAIAQGDLEQTIEPQPIREIDALTTRFNHMILTLQALFDQLEAANTELEDRVDRRTAELSDTLAKLQTAQLQLVQTEKMTSLGQLVAGVAHEINNPINFIHGNLNHASDYAQGLLHLLALYDIADLPPNLNIQHAREKLDIQFVQEDFPRLIQSMQVGANRIREIVLSLRNFSRLDEAEVKAVNLHEGLDNTLVILQNRFHGEGDRPSISISKHYEPLPLVECHPSQINQVFMNLLNNAIDAIEERIAFCHDLEPDFQPHIQVITQRISEQWVMIHIMDTGAGIPRDIQSKLFDPFFTSKPVGKGTGLGLFVSYQIVVEQHHGELTFTSSPGQGSQFKIKLPMQLNSPNFLL